ncbi:glycoside hydrolase family 88 protein [Marinoscillum pacificum]|uniref:glycoside hydrolase family 88 protein n=1 Tax=Marinoscillum pacificum TaxID=392723 RepID=UPI0021574C8B|nr:glycoside hydrolase family 88 protein [Marinoscillum pacificum]
MKINQLAFLFCALLAACSGSEQSSEVTFNDQIKSIYDLGGSQYQKLASNISTNQFPKTFENNKVQTSGSGWWCSGFYPGTLLYLFEETGDSALLNLATEKLLELEKEQYNTTTHDLGFMMFCSFGNAYRITSNPTYKEIIYQSSKSLITRFDSTIGCIRSWDAAPWNDQWQYPVIIDNMMNLEMLLWAAEEFNDSTFAEIAKTHANTTLKNHYREDFSSYHVISYDTITGEVEKRNTSQGYADESAWARGQAWGLYGFTIMYRFTKDETYLNQARSIAKFLLNHPNLPEDKVPYWDFNAPDIPNTKRDASAGAIIASALLELSEYVDQPLSDEYLTVAETMLKTLSNQDYLANQGEIGGFLLKHSVGHMPNGTEVDVPLSYADYYYIEALKRYQNLK